MEDKNDLVSEIARDELSRYRFMYSYEEKQMIREGKFKEVAGRQLSKINSYSWIVIGFILLFSGWSVYQFIDFGNTSDIYSLILGLCMWLFAIVFTHLFTKEIIAKKRSMELIIQLIKER